MTTDWTFNRTPEVDSMTKVELNDLLFTLLGSDDLVSRWWHTPNKNWDGRTPYSVWAENPLNVEQYITYFTSK